MSDDVFPTGETYFAPAERAELEEIRREAQLCLDQPIVKTLLEAISGYALILNAQRQLVAGNLDLFECVGCANPESLYGLRPGEILNCVHATEGPGGCGTSKACRQCGALLTLLTSQIQKAPAMGQCQLTLRHEGRLVGAEFKVRSTPLQIHGEELTAFLLQDLSAQMRRDALERVLDEELQPLLNEIQKGAAEDPMARSRTTRELLGLNQKLAEAVMAQRILARAEDGSLRPEFRETSISELLDELRARFLDEAVAVGRTLEIQTGAKGRVWTDPVLFLRVLCELVENAFEAIPVGGRVIVSHGRTAEGWIFTVQNPGALSERVTVGIFQRAFSTKASRGRGLGTYLARMLADDFLGGHLSFASDAARGTRFTFTVPDRGVATQPAEPASASASLPAEEVGTSAPPEAALVLVIDDSRTSRAILKATLSQEHRVITAASGEEGLEMAIEHQPDLILLDLVMPGLDGFAVCARIKSDPRIEETPVLFLSALGGEADETLALESGAIDFITKPISPVIVAARVRNHLELKRSRDVLRNLAQRDGLTGIANRRHFDQQMASEWQRTHRRGLPIAVVMGDVDFFKRYNDAYGHAAGDECLKAVAACFKGAMQRPGDLAARYGGEEFVCLLPETDLPGALEVAVRIQECVLASQIPHAHSSAAPVVTVSLGVASTRPIEGGSAAELLVAADLKLYQAKERGRNQVQG
ncbi:MAG TPA: diguanylate cyclase [Holophaga sp.]|nr:diguanylate cyclase [Holophaga sp.]